MLTEFHQTGQYLVSCYRPCLNSMFPPGFHSPSSVRQAAGQHLRSRVHGHRLWVWSLRLTSSHHQMGQKWRRCHPQWLFQNHSEFIWGSNLTSLTFTHIKKNILLLIKKAVSQLLFLVFFFFCLFFCRRSTTCRFWAWWSQTRGSISAWQKTMQGTSSRAPSSSSWITVCYSLCKLDLLTRRKKINLNLRRWQDCKTDEML